MDAGHEITSAVIHKRFRKWAAAELRQQMCKVLPSSLRCIQ